jgi:hypothetical protein
MKPSSLALTGLGESLDSSAEIRPSLGSLIGVAYVGENRREIERQTARKSALVDRFRGS